MITENYLISGMHCAACSASVERVTKRIDGVFESSVNLTTEKLTISYDETKVDSQLIIKYVQSAGFGISKVENTKLADSLVPQNKDEHAIFKLFISGVCALGLLVLCMGPMLFGLELNLSNSVIAGIEMVLSLCIMLAGLNHFKSGFKSLWHLAPNMDALVSVSCCVSFVYSLVQSIKIWNGSNPEADLYYESAGVVLFFIMLGKYMEANSKEKTKSAIKDLLDLSPKTALLYEDGNTKEIDVSALRLGDIVLIPAGGRVPADCLITKGAGDFDESSFTGEPLPVSKKVGDKLIGGSILSDKDVVFAKVTAVGEDTTLAEIVRFVEDAQGKKAPIASIADKVAGVFVPAVMAIAIVSATIWAILGKDLAFCLKIFTTVLVIACPCALGLATPTAIICGTGLGAKNGILIRSGEALENTHKANVAVLDKTGTLTYGKPEVCEVFSLGIGKDELITLAANVEKYSDHPLAKAVCEYAQNQGIAANEKLEEFVYVSGRGMIAEDKDGNFVYAGNLELMQEHNFDCKVAESFIKDSNKLGRSIIYIGKNKVLLGALTLSDKIKEESKELIDSIKALGIEPVLLTGDNKASANFVANALGIDKVYSSVLPKDKALVVEELKQTGKTVIMVGDGINDAPALTLADVGCAIGSGSDIAIDSADIVLMKNNPLDVARAIKLSKLTIKNIKQNLFWAFFYNCIGIPIAAGLLYSSFGILLSPMIGGLAMSFSSVFVVSNALRLRFKKL